MLQNPVFCWRDKYRQQDYRRIFSSNCTTCFYWSIAQLGFSMNEMVSYFGSNNFVSESADMLLQYLMCIILHVSCSFACDVHDVTCSCTAFNFVQTSW